jgi:colanic acid/amylovoran biosynthesis glycosyltransferase
MNMSDITLVVVSPLKGFRDAFGALTFTRKFIEGMQLYREYWDGPITLLCEPSDTPSNNLDNVAIESVAFAIKCAPMTADFLRASIPGRSVVLSSVGEQFNHVSSVCREKGVPCVYISEYTLKTRLQIVDEAKKPLIRSAWSKLRQVQQELAQRKAIRNSAGIQSNGLPTYDAYHRLNESPHLYFDGRVEESMLATEEAIDRRLEEMKAGGKIRLLFSGRLDPMKGVRDLPIVAQHLIEMRVPFEMSICGDGELKDELQAHIRAAHLEDHVSLDGILDFKSDLVPYVTREVDLFVCCHRQGDPSCTYVETMSCGVPVAGYANEALLSLARHSGAGWASPIGDPLSLAQLIGWIANNPAALRQQSMQSLAFARDHTFEKTFKRRISHLKQITEKSFGRGSVPAI